MLPSGTATAASHCHKVETARGPGKVVVGPLGGFPFMQPGHGGMMGACDRHRRESYARVTTWQRTKSFDQYYWHSAEMPLAAQNVRFRG
jgi:hypothetical protein